MASMDDIHRLEAKGLARAKIRSKRRRVQTIRSRTMRGSLALFAASWAIIFGQLVTGNDPALSRSSRHAGKLLASTHRAPRRSATPSDEDSAVAVSPPPVSDPAPTPVVTPAPAPAPVTVAPPPPPPVITSAS
jgi:hypothetical protein